jgi:hypothetical protein
MGINLRPKTNTQDLSTTQHSTILSGLEVIPGMSRFEMEFEFKLSGQPIRKLSVCTKNRVVFGKNKAKSDLRIAIEPFQMEEGADPMAVQENKRMTIGMISSVHFAISKDNGKVVIEDCGSTNGTTLNGKMLIPYKKTELVDDSILMVGKKLELQVTIFEHYPRREHLVLWGGVGFSNFQGSIIEKFDVKRQACALEIVNDKACIVNFGRKKMAMMGMQAGFRDGCPVQQDMKFEIGPASVSVV